MYILKEIFLKENSFILIERSLKFAPVPEPLMT